MARLQTPRQQLAWGFGLLAFSGAVIGHKLYRQASWGVDAVEVVVIFLPVGLYLVLKGFGFDVLFKLRPKPKDPE